MFQANATIKQFLNETKDPALVVEYYAPDYTPPFDPSDALGRFASVNGISVQSNDYTRLITALGQLKRTLTKEQNSSSVSFDNHDGFISSFDATNDFEGLIVVFRLISRSLTGKASDSLVLWSGQADQIDEGTRDQVTSDARQVFGSSRTQTPRRKFTPDDIEGRLITDPEFEGFPFQQQYGTTIYTRTKKYLWGLFKKKKRKVLEWSSFSDIDADRDLGYAFGRVQIAGVNLNYADIGVQSVGSTAFCEGKIEAFVETKTDDYRWTISEEHLKLGDIGGVGTQVLPPNHSSGNAFPGAALYSRTAWGAFGISGTQIENVDPAPTVIAVLLGKLLTYPNLSTRTWTEFGYSDNGAAVVYFYLTDSEFDNLDPAWIDEASFADAYEYNDTIIFDQSFTDLIFIPQGTLAENKPSLGARASTGLITTEYLKYLKGDATATEANEVAAIEQDYDPLTNLLPEDPEDFPTRGPGDYPVINLNTFLRRRYTTNVFNYERGPVPDFLHDVLLRNSRMFLTQGFDGTIKLKHHKPADFAYLRNDVSAGATSLDLDDVKPFIEDQRGQLLLGPHTGTSECRKISSAQYGDHNSIVITGSTFVSVTGFANGDQDQTPGDASFQITSVANNTWVEIDGFRIEVEVNILPGGDTVESIAGFFYAAINADPYLRRRFVATWDPGTAVVDVVGKFGDVTLESAIEYDHTGGLTPPASAPTATAIAGGSLGAGDYSLCYAWENENGRTVPSPVQDITVAAGQKLSVPAVAAPDAESQVVWYVSPAADSFKLRKVGTYTNVAFEIDLADLPTLSAELVNDGDTSSTEVLRVEYVLSDRASTRANITESNVLKSSYKWRLGKEQEQINQVEIPYRDSTQDFRLTTLRLKDKEHIARVKKTNPLSLEGGSIDNLNQAYRVANQELQLHRNADFFYNWKSDGESILLEEGDVIAITDSSAGVVNFPVFIRELAFEMEKLNVPLLNGRAQKYATSLFDDSVVERQIPIIRGTEDDYSDNLLNLPDDIDVGDWDAKGGTASGTINGEGNFRVTVGLGAAGDSGTGTKTVGVELYNVTDSVSVLTKTRDFASTSDFVEVTVLFLATLESGKDYELRPTGSVGLTGYEHFYAYFEKIS